MEKAAFVFRIVATLASLVASSVEAQDRAVTEAEILTHLRACYDAAEDPDARRACMFQTSEMCQNAEEGGGSTLGITTCNHSETTAWDVLLNEEYKATLAWAKTFDQEDQHHFPEFANREDSLIAAQRAWIAFRDAECGLRYAIWGPGSMRHIAGTACMLTETAERTIELRSMREVF